MHRSRAAVLVPGRQGHIDPQEHHEAQPPSVAGIANIWRSVDIDSFAAHDCQ